MAWMRMESGIAARAANEGDEPRGRRKRSRVQEASVRAMFSLLGNSGDLCGPSSFSFQLVLSYSLDL